jgi:GH43 family beta-xylosidase
MFKTKLKVNIALLLGASMAVACQSPDKQKQSPDQKDTVAHADSSTKKYISEPLISSIYTADPSAHVFNGKIYIYPSHDIESGIPQNDNGDHFNMKDFHVLSMDSIGGKVTDNGVALDIKDIPWAGRQLWAPDAAFEKGTYYLYFPVKDKTDVFHIGVATSKSPVGPFKAEAKPIGGSFSIDPCVFKDTDGSYYMYFGGIWGGQLQRWATGKYSGPNGSKTDLEKDDQPA